MLAIRIGCACLLWGTAAAQVFVVDASNGPGTHYTDLPAAVAAVPDGATLRVRAGSYLPFTLQNKGLRVTGEGEVKIEGAAVPVNVGPTGPAQLVLLRNVVLLSGGVRLAGAAGPVVLEQCRPGLSFAPLEIHATDCANVQVHECSVDWGLFGGSTPAVHAVRSTLHVSRSRVIGKRGVQALIGRSQPGGAGISLEQSRCVLVATTVVGGEGGPGCISFPGCNSDGGDGGAGVVATDSTVIALVSPITGGQGGLPGRHISGNSTNCGNGGDGLRHQGGLVALIGSQPLGGPLPPFQCRTQAGTAIVGQGALVRDAGAQPPSATVTGTQARGQNVRFTVHAPDGSVAVLALSYRGDLLPLESLGLWGSLLAAPAVSVGPVVVTTGNQAAVPVTLPNDLPLGEVYFGQFVTLTGQRLFLSNPFPLLATD